MLLLKLSFSFRLKQVHSTHYKIGQIREYNTLLLLWACLIDVVFLKATGNQKHNLVTRGGQTCKILSDKISFAVYATAISSYKDLVPFLWVLSYVVWWNILRSLCYSYFIIQRFGPVAVSQASSTITDGIKGCPTFDTGLIYNI
jgi:hypothetical protein